MDQILEFTNNNLLLVALSIGVFLAALFNELKIKEGDICGLSTIDAIKFINDKKYSNAFKESSKLAYETALTISNLTKIPLLANREFLAPQMISIPIPKCNVDHVKTQLLKKFNTRDGMGVELLHNASIKTIFLTGENSKITKKRAKIIGVDKCFLNIKHKESKLDEICKMFKIKYENIAYIGDDINDLKIMKLSNLSAAPNDAIPEIKSMS